MHFTFETLEPRKDQSPMSAETTSRFWRPNRSRADLGIAPYSCPPLHGQLLIATRCYASYYKNKQLRSTGDGLRLPVILLSRCPYPADLHPVRIATRAPFTGMRHMYCTPTKTMPPLVRAVSTDWNPPFNATRAFFSHEISSDISVSDMSNFMPAAVTTATRQTGSISLPTSILCGGSWKLYSTGYIAVSLESKVPVLQIYVNLQSVSSSHSATVRRQPVHFK